MTLFLALGNISCDDLVIPLLAEGVSRPSSPTTHLHCVYIPPRPVRKRKSLARRVMDSFREQTDREYGDNFDSIDTVNTVIKNNLDIKNNNTSNNNNNNDNNNMINSSNSNNNTGVNIYSCNEKYEKLRLGRRTSSVQECLVGSFLMSKETSLRDSNKGSSGKKVRIS